MKNECSIVRDLLPLYSENMLSKDTAEFVHEHIDKCKNCQEEFEQLTSNNEPKADDINEKENLQNDMLNVLLTFRKKLRKKALRIASVIAIVFLIILTLLHFFPIYRIAQIGSMQFGGYSYYSKEEVAMALYIGSASDRVCALSVLRQADKAFRDCKHTAAENDELYGKLARYATASDRYENVAFVNYSLELWSAHFDDDEGYLWVYYSSKAVDFNGNTVCASSKIPALWKVEKDDNGEWVVVQIREHP